MADLAQKKSSFIRRYVAAVEELLAADANLSALADEWSANGYANGAPPPEYNITDEDLALTAPWLTALQLNQAVGAADAVNVMMDEQRGYLESCRS